jgi:hypothetical protein
MGVLGCSNNPLAWSDGSSVLFHQICQQRVERLPVEQVACLDNGSNTFGITDVNQRIAV